MAEPLAEFQCGGESLESQLALAEAQVRDAAEVETVGLSPGILTVRMLGAVESFAGVLEGFARVTSRKQYLGEGEAEVDREFSESAGVGQKKARFGLDDRLRVVLNLCLDFRGRSKAAELEIDVSGAVGECAGFLQALSSLCEVIRKKETHKEGVAAA